MSLFLGFQGKQTLEILLADHYSFSLPLYHLVPSILKLHQLILAPGLFIPFFQFPDLNLPPLFIGCLLYASDCVKNFIYVMERKNILLLRKVAKIHEGGKTVFLLGTHLNGLVWL